LFSPRPGVEHAVGRQECVMDHSATSMENLDLDISVAVITLAGARQVWIRCPVVENQHRVDEAEAEVNRLLDQRLTAQV
jgi:hypothetical protein